MGEALVTADLILKGGRIWRGRGLAPHEALAVWGGKVLASGTSGEVMALAGPQTEIIDLEGRFACPGLNDNHLHLIATGLFMGWADATPQAAPSLAALLELLRARAAETPKGEWVLARGYDQTRLDVGVHPTRADLDRAAPDHPVLLKRACTHMAVANSKALELAGVTEATPAPEGGVIGRGADGRLDGLLAENAQRLVESKIPAPTQEALVEAVERGGKLLLSYGITSCMEAALGHVAGLAELRAYQQAKREGRLPLRVWLTLFGDPGGSIVEACWSMGLVTGVGDDMMRIGGVKLFLDGSAGGRTAWMTRPYKDQPENFGVQMLPTPQVEAMVRDLHGRGYRMACHAIGDGAVEQILTAYEKALAASPDPERRHRVEHCGYASPEHGRRMKAAGIYPAGQQVFLHDFGDGYVSVLGEERGGGSYPAGSWARLGLKPSTGSDSPVCSPNPFPNLHAMITRRTWRGTTLRAEERLSREEALQAFTEHGAYAEKAEATKGRLIPGQWADVAVFDQDLLEAPPEVVLSGTRCLLTLLAGRVVHDARG
ncbi:amidohydrolase [Neomegalonema perideroedes]|uniref:amidohydrolase n=1 Tax=Neomegalonema perideroedes TaxID=217219 RepID=UPI00036E2B8C|nr:amidohydrolase [Neomegalonema perideroedes]